jgi:hypothetical protein
VAIMTDWSRPVPRAEGAGRAGLSGLRARREKVYRDLKELYDVARAEAADKDAQLQRALRDVALLRSELRAGAPQDGATPSRLRERGTSSLGTAAASPLRDTSGRLQRLGNSLSFAP